MKMFALLMQCWVVVLMLPMDLALAAEPFPGRQPKVAADGNALLVAYGEGDTVMVRRSSSGTSGNSGDAAFGPAVSLRPESGGKLSLGMQRGPRIASTQKAVLVTAILGAQGGGKDGEIYLWRSNDSGASFGSPIVLNDVPGAAREGLHTMAANRTGQVVVAWLDLRTKGTKIYGRVSKDHGATWSPNLLLYTSPSGKVCECCHLSAVVDAKGTTTMQFRNSVDGNRDMYLLRLDAAGKPLGEAAKLGEGTWKLEACPMDGGDLKLNSKGEPVTVWRRQMQLFYARPGGKEELLGEGKHPTIATTDKGETMVWMQGSTLWSKGPGKSKPKQLAAKGAYPSLVSMDKGRKVFGAWEEDGMVRVATIQ